MEEDLDRETNPESNKQGLIEARKFRDAWGCSGRESDELPETASHLGPDQVAALDAVHRLVGFGRECMTCPRKYASLPWVTRAVIAWEFHDKGEIEAVEPNPLPILIEAVRLVDRGVRAAREETDRRRAEELAKLYPPQK